MEYDTRGKIDRSEIVAAVASGDMSINTARMIENGDIELTALRAEVARLNDKLNCNKCNKGHETLPLYLWDCPKCHAETKAEVARLRDERKHLYRLVKLDAEGNAAEPVRYVGVYVLRWGKVSEPEVAFAEVEE